uniref:mitogen-activated protein kinase kinase n=1 Tax=Acrobeloides nanus TaxID=290746 RepID=A0A914DWP6_9BILA
MTPRSSELVERANKTFSINFNQAQGPSNTTSEYYEILSTDPYINELIFADDAPKYRFNINDLVELETIAATRHIIKRMRHKLSNKELAVKSVHIPQNRHSTEDELKKLESLIREVQNFRELRNEPNIVRFYGFCIHEGQALICMELMDLSLKELSLKFIEKKQKFSEELLRCIIVAVLRSLVACKSKNIIYRDVKPENILLSRDGAIKLCDFGESRILHESLASTFVGTIYYWPPERFETEKSKYDVRADIWSLGITLIELVTGSVPYRDHKGNIPNNIIMLQSLIVNLDTNKTVEDAFGGYTEGTKDFVKSCLKKVKERPKYNELMETTCCQSCETIDSLELVQDMLKKHYYQDEGNEGVINNVMNFTPVEEVVPSQVHPVPGIPAEAQAGVAPGPLFTEEVLNGLHVMFPRVDKDVIKSILEEKRGDTDSTVTALLEMRNMQKGFSLNLNQDQGPSNATSEYYEQLLTDPHVNKLIFADDAPEYRFNVNELVELKTIATTRHVIKRMRHLPSNKELAVKSVHIPHSRYGTDDGNLNKLKYLVREIQNFRELRNEPNIVRFYGFCLNEGQAFICMELMDLSLKELSTKFIEKNQKFSEELLRCIILAVLKSLVACKSKNIIYRDVKPDNILLSRDGAIKLCDFGESRILQESLASTFAGSLNYWPPERFETEKAKYDVRADIWSLGITLIELATGSVPYRDHKGHIPNNIILLQSLIVKLDTNKTVEDAFGGYTEGTKDFVKSCLKKVEERPKYDELMKTTCCQSCETIDPQKLVRDILKEYYYQDEGEGVINHDMNFIPIKVVPSQVHPVPEISVEVQDGVAPDPLFTEGELNELHVMFPKVDKDVIQIILEEKLGDSDSTVTALLEMTSLNT